MKRLTILIALLLIVTACTANTSTRDSRNTNFRTGTEGLYYTFATNLPPARIYDDQKLDVLVELENRGATDLGGAGDRVYLTGFDPSIITGIPSIGMQIPPMRGKDVYGPGDKAYVSFQGTPVSLWGLNIDKYTPRLQLTACYLYDSVGSGNVCIDPDPNSINPRDKVCTAQSVSLGSQGGPVSISSIGVEASPGTTRFDITIQNSGRGTPFKSGLQYLQKCSPNDPTGLGYSEINYVTLVDVSIAGRSIKNSCRPVDGGNIRLGTGATHIYCQLDNPPGAAAFTSPLTVTLRYGYRETQQREVTIIQSAK